LREPGCTEKALPELLPQGYEAPEVFFNELIGGQECFSRSFFGPLRLPAEISRDGEEAKQQLPGVTSRTTPFCL
jgi:hypothetical protein